MLLLVFLPGCLLETQLWGDPDDTDDPSIPSPDDEDEDGFTPAEGDCDDDAPLVNPDATDDCDGIDNDCTGLVDDAGILNACATRTVHLQVLRADILVVLDNTESMSPHWGKAAQGACAMVEHLIGQGFDTHVGVVMTDMQTEGAEGALVDVSQKPGDPWIEGNLMPLNRACAWLGYALGDVVTYTPVETDPSGGRAAVTAAMAPVEGNPNEGFFRTDADLAVLYVNDEEDSSQPDNATFLETIGAQKAGTGRGVTVYAITREGEDDCEGDKTEEADSILALVASTGGMAESVCLDSYDGFLSGVGQDIAQQSLGDTFHLDSPAQLGTIEVTIIQGSEQYPWAGGIALLDSQTVVFTTTRPPAGATIVFDYLRAW